ncbi:MAG: HAD family hydrolase [Bacilli bacterium]
MEKIDLRKIKAIAFDLDGTLLTSSQKITVESTKLIKALKEMQINILFVTGRMSSAVESYANENCIEYIITQNGATLESIYNKSYLQTSKLNQEVVNYFDNELVPDSKDVAINFNSINDVSTKKITWLSCSYMEELDIKIHKHKKAPDNIVSIVCLGEKNSLSKVEKNVQGLFGNSLEYKYVSWYKGYWMLQFLNSGTDKYTMFKTFCELENIDLNDTLCFGDNYNDLELVESCGIGVAMENACSELKDKADFVTPGTNDKNGILQFFIENTNYEMIERKNYETTN